jgi:hypothetical protein
MLSRPPRTLRAVTGLIAGAAALSLIPAGAASAASRPHPNARPDATAPCGVFCHNYFTQEYGADYVLNDAAARQATGTPVTLNYASNSNPAEDWTIWPAGTVDQLAAFGIVRHALALHYGADEAFEAEYAPYGTPTGLCAGLASDGKWRERDPAVVRGERPDGVGVRRRGCVWRLRAAHQRV